MKTKIIIIVILALVIFAGCKKEKIVLKHYQVGVIVSVKDRKLGFDTQYEVFYVPGMFYRGVATTEYDNKNVVSYLASGVTLDLVPGDSVRMISDPSVSRKNRSYSEISEERGKK